MSLFSRIFSASPNRREAYGVPSTTDPNAPSNQSDSGGSYVRPAVEGGDIIYVSKNLAELGSEKLRGQSGIQTQTQTNDGEGAEGGAE